MCVRVFVFVSVCVLVCLCVYVCVFVCVCVYKVFIVLTNMVRLRHAVAQLVEALRCKREDRGFDSPWCHWNFSVT